MPSRPIITNRSTDPDQPNLSLVPDTLAPEATDSRVAPPGVNDADDIASLWIDTGQSDPLTVEHLHKIPIGKPKDFFMLVDRPGYRRKSMQYILKAENSIREEYYLVGPKMYERMIDDARPCIITVAVDRLGSPRIWPLALPREDENDMEVWETARAVAREGLTRWAKIVWKGRRFISRYAEEGYAPKPDYSKLPSLNELIRLAYGSSGIIRDENHPVYRALIGKAAPATGGLDADDGDDAEPFL
jgi:hypothetical protein